MATQPRHPVEGRQHDSFEHRNAGIPVPALTRNAAWEDEFPGQQQTTSTMRGDGWSMQPESQQHTSQQSRPGSRGQQPPPLFDPTPLTIEKSNILLLGPSGVGKTLMAKTLARVLEVPFSMSDCTPFTQAGYIGEDAEVCVQRLLAAANYDVSRAERGIICLDEIDKIATARVSHGKDVSGEGVQQALLKIIEGTTLQIQAKPGMERGSGRQQQGGFPPGHTPLGTPPGGQQSSGPGASGGQKGETYNVKTDNILFICAGAFNGLHKMVLDRISKGSIGFGATVRAAPGNSSSSDSSEHETILEGDDELFDKHLPYYIPSAPSPENIADPAEPASKRKHNTLDLIQPSDLQKYGLIPELVGRLPVACALSSLSIPALVKVLTEPRNSILKQYEQLFHLSSIELRFTTPALHTVATRASKMGTGARGLRTVMERLLADAMFEAPGSGTKFLLVTEAVAELKEAVVALGRGQQARFHSLIAEEEAEWEAGGHGVRKGEVREEAASTFEEYREKAGAAGF